MTPITAGRRACWLASSGFRSAARARTGSGPGKGYARGMASRTCCKYGADASSYSLLRFERRHVDGETVLHIGLRQSFVGFVDFLDGNHLDVGGDVVRAAEVEHLLGFGNAADGRTG